MQVSVDLYLYHSFLPLLMRVFRPPPVKGHFFYFLLAHTSVLLPLHLMWISGPLSKKWIISLTCILHITPPRLALTSHVVKSIHHNSHIALLTFVRDPPWFACLCHTDSRASAAIYPMHVLVCLRATFSILTTRLTYGPLCPSSWHRGTTYASSVGWPY